MIATLIALLVVLLVKSMLPKQSKEFFLDYPVIKIAVIAAGALYMPLVLIVVTVLWFFTRMWHES